VVDRDPEASGRIFISYRREETAYPAGWLFDRLSDRFGNRQIFKDIDSIEPGDDFVDRITSAVGSCDVLLALIGDEWLTVVDGTGQRRLDDHNDFVRLEIEAALSRDVRVIPLLVDGARMPGTDELPPSLHGLVRRQALELSPSRFTLDLDRLVRVLDRTVAAGPAPDAPVAAADEALPPPPPGIDLRRILSTPRRIAVAAVALLVAVVIVVSVLGGSGGGSPDGGDGSSEEESPSDDPSADESSSGSWPALASLLAARGFVIRRHDLEPRLDAAAHRAREARRR